MWHEQVLSTVNHTCDIVCCICNAIISDFRRGRLGKNSPQQASSVTSGQGSQNSETVTQMETTERKDCFENAGAKIEVA
jgi:hypothetical protein